jgi:hypothetical protein
MREDHSETRKRAERDPDVDAASCDHSFHMSENAVFTGTEGARGCGTCKHRCPMPEPSPAWHRS